MRFKLLSYLNTGTYPPARPFAPSRIQHPLECRGVCLGMDCSVLLAAVVGAPFSPRQPLGQPSSCPQACEAEIDFISHNAL